MWVDLLAGASIFGAGQVTGRVMRRRARYKPKKVEPWCGCDHHIAMHDQQTKECHAEDKVYINGFSQLVRCKCRRYTGPEPLPEYYAPEIA